MPPLRRLCVPLLLLAIAATLLINTSHHRVAAQQESQAQKLWGIFWTAESGFTSTLEMKNNLAEDPLRVGISLYFANGEEYALDPVQLGPRQTTSIDLNRIIASLPNSVAGRAGKEGTLEVEFEAPTPSALMGSVSVRNEEWGSAWNFFLYPRNAEATAAALRGVFWFNDKETDGFVALQNISAELIQLNPRF